MSKLNQKENMCTSEMLENRKINMENVYKDVTGAQFIILMTLLNDKISSIFNECFPLIKVKVSTRDPPYMSPLIKHLCNKRNIQIKIGLNPDIQGRINKLIRLNQIRSVNDENRRYNRGNGETR